MFSRLRAQVYRPSDEFLQRIDGLSRSSPEFPVQLANLLEEKEVNFVKKLRSKDIEWLIEYLDKVCAPVAWYPLPTELL